MAQTDAQDQGSPQGSVPSPQDLVASAINAPYIPKLYGNGFSIAWGAVDVTMVLQLHNAPVAVISCPVGVAKEVVQKINEGMAKLEVLLGHPIPSIGEVTQALDKSMQAQKGSK